MSEELERARERRNILERLGSKIPGFSGYLEREMRREVDKLQRDWLADQVDRARFAINGKVREWSRDGRLENLDRASSIEKSTAVPWPVMTGCRLPLSRPGFNTTSSTSISPSIKSVIF